MIILIRSEGLGSAMQVTRVISAAFLAAIIFLTACSTGSAPRQEVRHIPSCTFSVAVADDCGEALCFLRAGSSSVLVRVRSESGAILAEAPLDATGLAKFDLTCTGASTDMPAQIEAVLPADAGRAFRGAVVSFGGSNQYCVVLGRRCFF